MRKDPDLTRRRAQLYYAESWALVQFLRARGGKYVKVLDEYFVAEMEGQTLRSAPKELFENLVQKHLGKELALLEDEFVNYILSLR